MARTYELLMAKEPFFTFIPPKQIYLDESALEMDWFSRLKHLLIGYVDIERFRHVSHMQVPFKYVYARLSGRLDDTQLGLCLASEKKQIQTQLKYSSSGCMPGFANQLNECACRLMGVYDYSLPAVLQQIRQHAVDAVAQRLSVGSSQSIHFKYRFVERAYILKYGIEKPVSDGHRHAGSYELSDSQIDALMEPHLAERLSFFNVLNDCMESLKRHLDGIVLGSRGVLSRGFSNFVIKQILEEACRFIGRPPPVIGSDECNRLFVCEYVNDEGLVVEPYFDASGQVYDANDHDELVFARYVGIDYAYLARRLVATLSKKYFHINKQDADCLRQLIPDITSCDIVEGGSVFRYKTGVINFVNWLRPEVNLLLDIPCLKGLIYKDNHFNDRVIRKLYEVGASNDDVLFWFKYITAGLKKQQHDCTVLRRAYIEFVSDNAFSLLDRVLSDKGFFAAVFTYQYPSENDSTFLQLSLVHNKRLFEKLIGYLERGLDREVRPTPCGGAGFGAGVGGESFLGNRVEIDIDLVCEAIMISNANGNTLLMMLLIYESEYVADVIKLVRQMDLTAQRNILLHRNAVGADPLLYAVESKSKKNVSAVWHAIEGLNLPAEEMAEILYNKEGWFYSSVASTVRQSVYRASKEALLVSKPYRALRVERDIRSQNHYPPSLLKNINVENMTWKLRQQYNNYQHELWSACKYSDDYHVAQVFALLFSLILTFLQYALSFSYDNPEAYSNRMCGKLCVSSTFFFLLCVPVNLFLYLYGDGNYAREEGARKKLKKLDGQITYIQSFGRRFFQQDLELENLRNDLKRSNQCGSYHSIRY